MSVERDLVKKSGSWYSYGETKIAQAKLVKDGVAAERYDVFLM